MITHVALYSFRSSASKEQIEQFMRELAICSNKTGLVSRYSGGLHLSLPADEAIRNMVYDYAAIWEFASLEELEEFSRHPIMATCVATYVQPVVERLAITNFVEANEREEKEHGF
jgi:hypothetical protein